LRAGGEAARAARVATMLMSATVNRQDGAFLVRFFIFMICIVLGVLRFDVMGIDGHLPRGSAVSRCILTASPNP
jgi:hypothetical protein